MMDEIQEVKPKKDHSRTRKYASQDVRINETINTLGTIVSGIRSHPAIAAVLADHGYDEARLEEGLKLTEHTRRCFHNRAAAITARQSATIILRDQEKAARRKYAKFRLIAHAVFPDENVHPELGISGRVPQDREQFTGIAEMSAAAARRPPYADLLSEYGFDSEAVDDLENALLALRRADSVQDTAIMNAIKATRVRDTAFEELQAWLQRFRSIAKAALRDHPERLHILDA